MKHERQMMLVAKILGVIVVIVILSQLIFSRNAVSDSSFKDWKAEVEYLNQRIVESQNEYRITAQLLTDIREQVTLHEATLKKLNSLNNERRARIRILQRKIDRFLAQGEQE